MTQSQTGSIHERIVSTFLHYTEVHKKALCTGLGITADQFEAAIPRARDLGIEYGLFITPIYDPPGWWTSEPTDRILALAAVESAKRNIGESERNARVAHARSVALKSARSQELSEGLAYIRLAYNGALGHLRERLPEQAISSELDYVINRVNRAATDGRPFVRKEPVLEAAA